MTKDDVTSHHIRLYWYSKSLFIRNRLMPSMISTRMEVKTEPIRLEWGLEGFKQTELMISPINIYYIIGRG